MSNTLTNKIFSGEFLSFEEAMFLYSEMETAELIFIANEIRKNMHPENVVTWLVDRNINITNACVAMCKFCNFHRKMNHPEVYVTTIDEYKAKIDEMYQMGGRQLLLQGGLHPKFGLDFYKILFSTLKSMYPDLKLHALGPAEIVQISRLERTDVKTVLKELVNSGLDSLPGAGAEILSNRVRQLLSRGKCSTEQWLDVMRDAHKMNLITSATMMFGHIETIEERIQHLMLIRDLQNEKPKEAPGFIAFICWPFQDKNTVLQKEFGITNTVNSTDYIRMVALSRILLPNIKNIQASWLTVGKEIGQICLHAGANDFGSVMIEENVVSAAGAQYKMDISQMQQTITDAGFVARQRNQKYEYI